MTKKFFQNEKQRVRFCNSISEQFINCTMEMLTALPSLIEEKKRLLKLTKKRLDEKKEKSRLIGGNQYFKLEEEYKQLLNKFKYYDSFFKEEYMEYINFKPDLFMRVLEGIVSDIENISEADTSDENFQISLGWISGIMYYRITEFKPIYVDYPINTKAFGKKINEIMALNFIYKVILNVNVHLDAKVSRDIIIASSKSIASPKMLGVVFDTLKNYRDAFHLVGDDSEIFDFEEEAFSNF